jgi:hypothetical protein
MKPQARRSATNETQPTPFTVSLSNIPFVVSLSNIPFVVSLSNHAFRAKVK